MAKLIIKRSNEFNNRLRSYNIFVDGERIGSVANGQAEEFSVPAGEHKIIAKITWCSSPELSFNIGENEKKYFRVGGFKLGKFLTPLALLIAVLSVLFKNKFGITWVSYLIIPVLLVLIYYLTFGRKDYLTIKETEGIL